MHILEQVHEKGVKERRWYKQEHFRPSSLGGCQAEQLFNLAGFKPNRSFNQRTKRTFEVGDAIEVIGNKLLTEAGFTIFGKDFELTGTNPQHRGLLDGFIIRDGIAWPYDWKSAGSFGFNKWIKLSGKDRFKTQQAGWTYYDPRESNTDYCPVKLHSSTYYYQAQTYMYDLLRRKEELNLDPLFPCSIGEGFYFFVFCKDNSALYEEFVPFVPGDIEERFLTLEAGLATINKKGLSNKQKIEAIRERREYSLKNKDYQCTGCQHLRRCWGEEESKLVARYMKK